MAQSFYGILSSFDHNINDWKTYKGRVTQWFIANNIDAKNDRAGIKRRAIVLSVLNDGTYKLAADLALPKHIQDVPYEDLVALLDNHFIPKRCGAASVSVTIFMQLRNSRARRTLNGQQGYVGSQYIADLAT